MKAILAFDKNQTHQTVIHYILQYSVCEYTLWPLVSCTTLTKLYGVNDACKYEYHCHGKLLDFIENLRFWSVRDRI